MGTTAAFRAKIQVPFLPTLMQHTPAKPSVPGFRGPSILEDKQAWRMPGFSSACPVQQSGASLPWLTSPYPLPCPLPSIMAAPAVRELVAEPASAPLPRPRAQLLILARSPRPPLPREAIYHQLRGHGRGPAAHRRFYAAIKTI